MSASQASSPAVATGHVFIATSLDGFIARRDGGIDWLDRYATGGQDHGYDAFMASVDGIVMGRGTFETARSFPALPYTKPVVVMSRTLSEERLRADVRGKVRLSTLAPQPLMATLFAEGLRRVYVDGGKVIRSFLNQGLIADMVLTRVPILLGDGIPLFGGTTGDIALRHVGTTAFASGLVQSKYEVG
jgi:dihydrofolate reductase